MKNNEKNAVITIATGGIDVRFPPYFFAKIERLFSTAKKLKKLYKNSSFVSRRQPLKYRENIQEMTKKNIQEMSEKVRQRRKMVHEGWNALLKIIFKR